jgi:carbon starvation protein
LGRRHQATLIAVGTALLLAFSSGADGTGALLLWPLFGAVNQLLAGLALLVITVWLKRNNKPTVFTLAPMILMLFVTGWAMGYNLKTFFTESNLLLFSIGCVVLLLEIWMVIEGSVVFLKRNRF